MTPRDAGGFAVLGPAAADIGKMLASGVKAACVDGEDLVIIAAPKGLLIAPRAHAPDALGAARRGALAGIQFSKARTRLPWVPS